MLEINLRLNVFIIALLTVGAAFFLSSLSLGPAAYPTFPLQLQNLSKKGYVICSSETRGHLNVSPSGSQIHTLDNRSRTVECLAVKDGLVIEIGSKRDVLGAFCPEEGRLDAHPTVLSGKSKERRPKGRKAERLKRSKKRLEISAMSVQRSGNCDVRFLRPGQALFPGFQDAHGHVLDYGWSRTAVDLVGSKSVEEVIRRIEDYIKASPELFGFATSAVDADAPNAPWIMGLGWDQTGWNPPVFPVSSDISKSPLLSKFPIALRRIDVHALWLSDKALKMVQTKSVGFPQNRQDDEKVEGGLVVRNATGHPTGVLVDNAMNLAYQVIPSWTDTDRQKYLDAAAEGLLSVGITSVGDAAVDLDSIRFYKSLDRKGNLPFRIYAFLACPPGERRCASREKPSVPSPGSDGKLTLRAVKLFADGALGSWGSAMWEEYSDKPGDRGMMLIPKHEVKPLIRYWIDNGWQVCTHAIGDRANTLALDAYEDALNSLKKSSGSTPDLRPRIEHAQILRLEDIPRFAQVGVIASMQPTHCTSDMGYVEERIGFERAQGAYPWQSLIQHNATLALGSDFPVELPNPLHGIYSAISRLDADGDSPAGPGGWFPKERLTREEALRGFTSFVSYAQYEEHLGGSLAKGKRADFVVLDRDIMDEERVTPIMVRNAVVEITAIDGKVVYNRAEKERKDIDIKPESPYLLLSVLGKMIDLALQVYKNYPVITVSILVVLLMMMGILKVSLDPLFDSDSEGRRSEAYEGLESLALNAKRPETEWMNMGLWCTPATGSSEKSFPEACEALAKLMHRSAELKPQSSILDVGHGNGDSLLLLKRNWNPAVLHGVTSLRANARRAEERLSEEIGRTGDDGSEAAVWCQDAVKWLSKTGQGLEKYDAILALDCMYHFPDRAEFLRLAYDRLEPGGVLATIDLFSSWPRPRRLENFKESCLPPPIRPPTLLQRFKHRLVCMMTGVPPAALWSFDRYAAELERSGFHPSNVQMKDISADVFPGFSAFLQGLGRGSEKAWRGGSWPMIFGLQRFGDVVASWAKGGDEGLVRCGLVVARKGLTGTKELAIGETPSGALGRRWETEQGGQDRRRLLDASLEVESDSNTTWERVTDAERSD
ncbi:hypothetical protein IE53DRAFT_309695 [Violaceomyces palustris]|uniref:Uncharacterized protein n=1 Tax=Violaceomyces palustris TaxID=1673888 RepID=A0ACD0P702_9BASI|nr:hypothetical protein IE53DRAFT_309695 [Violaceomyces palustris]